VAHVREIIPCAKMNVEQRFRELNSSDANLANILCGKTTFFESVKKNCSDFDYSEQRDIQSERDIRKTNFSTYIRVTLTLAY